MSTESFDKNFVVRDAKAIEQFLHDLEFGERPKYTIIQPTPEQMEQKEKVLALLKQKMSQKS